MIVTFQIKSNMNADNICYRGIISITSLLCNQIPNQRIKDIFVYLIQFQDMSFDSYGKNKMVSSGLLSTNVPKRQAQWNSIEPGDPYDIRKSMIARLPGENKIFMGEHLEIVCLLQAAEMERLVDNLDDYKLRFKEMEKRDLDRHSYEIQIKELTERAFDGDKFKKENDKLREFIQKQTIQLEEYKKKANDGDSSVQAKYHKALKQIQNMHKDNLALKTDLNQAISEINTWSAKFEALERSKNKEIEQMKYDLQRNGKVQYQRQMRELQLMFTNERSQFQIEFRRVSQSNEAKNREIEQLRLNIAQFSKKMQEYSGLADKFEEDQAKIMMATQEIQRLNRVLKDRNAELRDHQGKLFDTETKSRSLESEFARMKSRLENQARLREQAERRNLDSENQLKEVSNISRKIAEYENRLAMVNQQRERLEAALKSKSAELNERDKLARDLEFELESSRRKLGNLEGRLGELNILSEKIIQHEVHINKLTIQLQTYDKERETAQEAFGQNELLRRKINELGVSVSKVTEYEYKIEIISRQIDRLNNIIENKNKEIQSLQGQCLEGQNSSRQLKNLSDQLRKIIDENKDLHEELREGQEKLRISNAQQQKLMLQLNDHKMRISGSDQQTEEFRKKIQLLLKQTETLDDEVRKGQEGLRLSTSQNSKLMQELNELRSIGNAQSETYKQKMQRLMNQNNGMGQEIRTAQENLRLSAGQIGKLTNELKITCNENEELKRRIVEVSQVNRRIPEYESKIALFSQQIQRLNAAIEKKNSQIRNLGGEIKEAQDNLRLSAQQQSRLSSELNEFKIRLTSNNSESETYKQRIQKLLSENTSLGEQVRGAQQNLRLSASQIGKLNNELKIACNDIEQLKKRLQDSSMVNRKLPEYQNKIALLSQQIQRLNSVIQKKNLQIRNLGGQIKEVQQNLRLSSAQYSKINTELNDHRARLATTGQQSQTYKLRIQKLLNENNTLGEQMRTAQQNLRLSAGQINKLTNEIKIICGESEELKKRVFDLQNTLKKTNSEGGNRINILTQQCERLNSIVEKKNMQIRNLGGEVQQHQESLRLSAAQANKLNSELNQFKNRFGSATQESETYKQRIQKLLSENTNMGEQIRNVQQNLRLSAGTISKLNNELKLVCNENEQLKKRLQDSSDFNRKIPDLENRLALLSQQIERLNAVIEKKNIEIGNLNKKMAEIEAMTKTIGTLQQKITGLLNDNKSLDGDMRQVQQNLRLSTSQNQRIVQELNDYKLRIASNDEENKLIKAKIQKLVSQNSSLGTEMQTAQENLRLSAGQISKLNNELNQYKNQINTNNKDSEMFRLKIQKLLSENTSLGQQVRTSQQNLRLSAGQISKLTNELKNTYGENQQLKKQLSDFSNVNRRIPDLQNKIAMLSQQIQRLNQVMDKKNNEIRALGGEVQEHQQNLRLSAAQANKLNIQLNEYRNRLGSTTQQTETFKIRIQKLISENTNLGEEVRTSQQNLRLSASQIGKLTNEFKIVCSENQQLKKRIQQLDNALKRLKAETDNKLGFITQQCDRLNIVIEKKNNEIRALGGQVQEAQQNIRLSTAQASKLAQEINQYRNRIGVNSQQIDTYKQRLQKLIGENNSLNIDVRQAQENLRLSAGTMAKLQTEFKSVCVESDQLKKKLLQYENAFKRVNADSENKTKILTQQCERLNALVQKRNSEIRALGGQVQQAQQNVRLSAAQASKLNAELNDTRNRLGGSVQEIDSYKIRIQKLLGENSNLGNEIKEAQQNLRLSSGTMSKLQNEFKTVCGENDQMKKRLTQYEVSFKRLNVESENKVRLLTQECERLNALVEKRSNQIRALGGEVQQAQQNLRLSAQQSSKLTAELTEYRNRLGITSQEQDSYKQRIQKLLSENTSLGQEVRSAQQNLRLSAGTLNKLQAEFKSVCGENDQLKRIIDQFTKTKVPEYENRIVILSQEIERLNGVLERKTTDLGNLQRKLSEIDGMNKTIGTLQQKITKLVTQNTSMDGQIRTVQQNLRLSANQNNKIMQELNDYKNRIANNDQQNNVLKQKINNLLKENANLDEEVKGAQENLRLSANQMSKLNAELNQYKNKINANNAESDNYRQRMQKLMSENSSLSQEVRSAQENIRLSAGQIGKLSNQLKIVCNENDELRKKWQESDTGLKRLRAEHENKIAILTQECERLNALVEKRNSEIRALGGQVQSAQENLRLSSQQSTKLNAELTEYKNRLGGKDQEFDTYKQRIQKLLSENSSLGEEVRTVQENLRLSAGTMSKLQSEFKTVCAENDDLKKRIQDLLNSNRKIAEYENKIAVLSQEIERLSSQLQKKTGQVTNLNRKLIQIDSMNKTIGTLQEKITRLVTENTSIEGQVRSAQDNLRLSANQNAKMQQELNQYKMRIDQNTQENNLLKQKMQKILGENSSLNEEVRTAQEGLRLSSATQAKLNAELNQYREQININNKESETYRIKIQKLVSENTSLGDEMRGAQENLRLSAGTINKLNNELKITCNQNQELKKRLQDAGTVNKRLPEYESKIAALSQEIERLNMIIDKKNNEIKNMKEAEAEAENMSRQLKSLSDQLRRITGEKDGLFEELRTGQEQIRLSNNQISKLKGEVDDYKLSLEGQRRKSIDVTSSKVAEYESKIALFSQQIERLNSALNTKNNENINLKRRLQQIDEMNHSIGSLQQKIKKLVSENYSYEEEMRSAQENLRLSANQNAKMAKELNEYRQRIEQNNQENESLKGKIGKLVSENSSLGEQVKSAQESLRLSSATQAKLARELNEYKQRVNNNNNESETYKIKLQKLMAENTALGDQMRGAQQNLRLSAGTINKLNNELKITCNEVQELKRRLEEALRYKARCLDLQEKTLLLSAQIQRLRNSSSSVQNENQGSKKKLIEYETKFAKVSLEFEKLNNIIQQLRKQNQVLKQSNYELEAKTKNSTFNDDKIKVLNEEIDRLTVLVEEKEEDLGEFKLRFSDESSLVKRIQEHLALFVVLFAEIESLRKRVKDKEKEVETVRRSSLAPFRN